MSRPVYPERPGLDARRELCEAKVTLDGQPAKICGTRNEFATVRMGTGLAVEFAWATVALIVSRGGAFKS